jgi:hypothetical protein
MANNLCKLCRKPLSGYSDIKLGICSVCRTAHADFSVVDIGDDYIYIKDNDTGKTVTNDAPWVLAELMRRFGISKKRVLYMDTSGMIDELVHEDGVFKGFKPGFVKNESSWR